MAQCTREQVNRWNTKLSNGFRLDLERFIIWNDKVATRSIELPDGKVLKADIGWTEVREEPKLGCFYQKAIGMMPMAFSFLVDSERHAGYVVQPWPGCRGKNHRQHLPET